MSPKYVSESHRHDLSSKFNEHERMRTKTPESVVTKQGQRLLAKSQKVTKPIIPRVIPSLAGAVTCLSSRKQTTSGRDRHSPPPVQSAIIPGRECAADPQPPHGLPHSGDRSPHAALRLLRSSARIRSYFSASGRDPQCCPACAVRCADSELGALRGLVLVACHREPRSTGWNWLSDYSVPNELLVPSQRSSLSSL